MRKRCAALTLRRTVPSGPGQEENEMNIADRVEQQVLLDGLAFPESPRWHDGRLWVSDWGAGEVIATDLQGSSEVIARIPSFPMCIDHLPDGRLLVVSSSEQRLVRQE